MKITDKALKEFEQIWLTEHPGQKLDKQQLLEMAQRTLMIVNLVYCNKQKPENNHEN